MTDDRITDYALTKECEALAAEIFDAVKAEHIDPEAPWDFDPEDYRDEMDDRAHESADGHQWVIYTYKAIQLCAECNTDEGEAFLEDVGPSQPITFGGLETQIAYGEMRARIMASIDELIEGYTAPEEPDEDEEDEEDDA